MLLKSDDMAGIFKRFIKRHFIVNKVTATEIPILDGALLKNKTALIVGGSGGIGIATAKAFYANGCSVIIVGTNEAKLKKVCDDIGSKHSYYIVADISKLDEIKVSVEKAISFLGRIDILVHCAGIHCHENFGHISEETWDRIIDVNLKSMYFYCQYVSDYMIKNHIKGHILNVGSASCAKPGWTPYEISKSAVRSLTLGFADKLISHGIVVNSIAPGPVATPMLNREDENDVAWPGNPTGRMSTPAEIANWMVFMASDMGNMVVGETLFVSGGSGTICLDK